MSHEVESMFYVDQVPWHGLGVPLDAPPTIEEGIKLAGLDWTVDPKPIYLEDRTPIQKRRAVVRSDNKDVLGIVGKNWKPLQNVDAFKFFQPFIDAGQCTLETAGSLRNGRHVFVLAKIQRDPISVVKGDDVVCYLLLANGHDGSLAVSVQFTPIRVVCANTLAASLENSTAKILRIIHSQKVEENLELVQDTVNLVTRQFEATAEQYKRLASRQIKDVDLRRYVKLVFFPDAKSGRKKKVDVLAREDRAADRLYEKIVPLFLSGRGNDLKGVKGTWWGAYNAITEHLSYDRGRSQDIRMDSLWFGAGQSFNQRALDTALSLAE